MAHKDSTAEKKNDESGLHSQVRALINDKNYTAARDLLLQSLRTTKTAESYCDLGEVYSYMGNKNEAVITFENAIKIDPKCHKAYACIAELLLSEGHIFHAIDYFVLAIQAKPDSLQYRQAFLTLAQHLQIKAFNKDVKAILTDSLKIKDLSFSKTTGVWWQHLQKDPSFKDILKAVGKDQKDTYAAFKKASTTNHRAYLDPYFLLGIKTDLIPFLPFEKLMTYLRRFMLEQYDAQKPVFSESDYVQVATALANNCLLTDYVFNSTGEEQNKIKTLKDSKDKDLRLLSVLACYESIYKIPGMVEISSKYKATAPEFIDTHINDFAIQKEIRESITAITKISEGTSALVREQYEEFPYPRWTNYDRATFNEEIEGRFRNGKFNMLNAGCGTGHEAICLGSLFPDSKVLAVDLSRTSLAFGIKRARDYNIKNVDFKQGDILLLGDAVKDRFDYIVSAGVLHHMKEPSKGLAVLNGLLKPDGIMRLGLYSQIGHRFHMIAQKIIREKGFKSDADDIRRFRAEANDILDKNTIDNLCSYYRDYFTLPECRDLLFHVQEHRFTIPQIEEFLAAQNLEFMQFYTDALTLQKYKKAYPNDKDCNNLGNWDDFEKKNPDTFKSMYMFWCRKKTL